ncbi:hypothetical protein KY363_04385 [Candidatus Woesearchaeota archaeon]|nr:hypothetical protein [Candidatus Woesearchaeota archaeon]
MKGGKTALILFTLLIAMLSTAQMALAVKSTGHIKLLAVYEEDGVFKGSPADLQLEIKKGSGRVFLETIPLSKVDTQISTRFAKEVACKFAEVDCDAYDFFYTIKSPAGIVGGPSAGGAVAVLTVAMLEDLDVDQDAAMTGTINSGNLVGPVGSLDTKIEAAKEAGVSRVIVPSVQSETEDSNVTNITGYGEEIGIEVVPVSTLNEALEALTGESFAEEDKEIDVPDEYLALMKQVSEELCNRTADLMGDMTVLDLTQDNRILPERVQDFVEAQNLSNRGKEEFNEGNYYSAASYCFGAGIRANILLHTLKNYTEPEKKAESDHLQQEIDTFDRKTESRDKETITDLQTYMIVKERILEAKQYLATAGNDTKSFGYVEERLNSAVTWSAFFGQGGERFDLDETSLQDSCAQILGETDERFQYLNLFFPGLLKDIRNNLMTAHSHSEKGEYALCIYLASRTKAESNVMVTLLGVKEDYVDELIELKLNVAKNAIVKQIDNGIFPIIAYSYYEYANSLKEENPYAALMYAEYALELSDIDIYFEKEKTFSSGADIMSWLRKYLPTIIFVWGIILGVLLAWIVMRERAKEKTEKHVKARPPKRKLPARKKRGRTNIRLS